MEGCVCNRGGIGQKESFLRELGADEFIDYHESDPVKVAKNLDLVLDTLGGPTTGRFLRTLKGGGALFPVFLGFSDAEEASKLGVTVSATQVRSNGRSFQNSAILQHGRGSGRYRQNVPAARCSASA